MARDYSAFAASDDEKALADVKPFDASKGRDQLIARIDRTLKQLNGEIGLQGGSDFSRKHHNVIHYRPTLKGQRIYLTLDSEEHFATTTSKMPGLLEQFRKDVEAEVYDDQIKHVLTATAPTNIAPTGKRKAAGTGTPRGQGLGKVSRPDDPEWMAKFREKVGEPDPSIVDPVPNSKGTKWVPRANTLRGQSAAATRYS
ncbi:hypothetical protein [Sphingomonas sp. R1]|uniref:hypothetical protein n=1 Tax=Sphingomonas sp. R1 TaxID=399176 RepID=UPI002224A443|nr:hypothetical protein [Sphingomonas sp. R1]UYY77519.1 hypothetical protein OIM94_00450 [Sphingomonas sp. R1]